MEIPAPRADRTVGTQEAKAEPGMRRPVQAEEAYGKKNCRASQDRHAERNPVAKLLSILSRKAAIVLYGPVP